MSICQYCDKDGNNISVYEKLLIKKIWDTKDVANFTGFKQSTIYNKVHNDKIPYLKKDGKLYFLNIDIQNWMTQGD